MRPEPETIPAVPHLTGQQSRPRPLWAWTLFFLITVAALVGCYVLIYESPHLTHIRYIAQYQDKVALSGRAVGYYRWQYDSIVAHAPLHCSLAVEVDGRRLAPSDLTPRTLSSLGATATHESQSTLWRLTRGADSLWCDFQQARLVQFWIEHDSGAPTAGNSSPGIGLVWNGGPVARLPIDARDLPHHFGPPQRLSKESKLRFLAGL
jgi:hypothetical protein